MAPDMRRARRPALQRLGVAAAAAALLQAWSHAVFLGGDQTTTSWLHSHWPERRGLDCRRGCLPERQLLEVGSGSAAAEAADKVDALRAAIGPNGSEPLADPLMLLRFINARKGDEEKAADMHNDAVQWRSSVGLREVMQEFGDGEDYTEDGRRASSVDSWRWTRRPKGDLVGLVARHVSFARLPVLSPDGEPILIWRFKADDFDLFTKQNLKEPLINSYIAHIEDTLQALRALSIKEKRLVKARFVIDVKDCGLWSVRYLPSLRKATGIGQRYFPETVTSVTVVRAPPIAAFVYNLIKAFVPMSMQLKINILGDDFQEGLKAQAGLESKHLPTYLGGEVDVELT